MKKLLILGCCLFLISCSSEDSPEQNNPGPTSNNTLLITKIDTYKPDGLLYSTSVCVYNNDNFLSKINHTNSDGQKDEIRFIYNNGKLVKRMSYDDNGSFEGLSYEYLYDGSEIYQVIENSSNSIVNTYYSYNSKGFVKSSLSDYNKNKTPKQYTYDAENNVLSRGGDTFEYDNKKDFSALLFPISFYKIKRLSDHNMTKSSSGNTIYTYEYKYRSDGYPNEIIRKENGDTVERQVLKYN